MTSTILSVVGTLAAAVAAVVGLWLAVISMRQNSRAVQMQVLESVVSQIRDLEFRYNTDYKQKSAEDKRFWDGQFFNMVEYLSFLINHRLISSEKLISFFGDGVIHWHEDMFVKLFPQEDQFNPKEFEEFKKLYLHLKHQRINQAVGNRP